MTKQELFNTISDMYINRGKNFNLIEHLYERKKGKINDNDTYFWQSSQPVLLPEADVILTRESSNEELYLWKIEEI